MIGPELRTARRRFGLSQAVFAKKLKVDRATLVDWEKERRPIPIARQYKIASVFALLMRSPWLVGKRLPCPTCSGAGMVPAVYQPNGQLMPAPLVVLDRRMDA